MAQECANPLLLGWLKEWMDEAQSRNSKGYTVYKKAYLSMKACPLTFEHPAEAQQLNGLGPKLCDRLADKLKKHCAEHGIPMPEKQGPKGKRKSTEAAEEDPEATASKKPRKIQLYVPRLRSGAYALILALAELDEDGTQALSKSELIDRAQPYCDASFTAPSDPTKFFTAWKSMQTLESKELVCTRGHPTKRYCLSDEGWEVARRMQAAERPGQTGPSSKKKRPSISQKSAQPVPNLAAGDAVDIEDLDSDSEDTGSDPTFRTLSKLVPINDSGFPGGSRHTHPSESMLEVKPIVLQPGTFEVQMVLDTREIRTKTDRDYLSNELRKLDVIADTRALPLGDVLWIAKVKEPYDSGLKAANLGDEDEGSTEIVLEHVVERKRLDDLIGSIKDGRFHEQKFRLRKSGMRNVTYLIEDYSISTEKSDKYGEAVESAVASMQAVNDIFVKKTSKIDDTIRYLARMTKTLKELYERKELNIIPSRALDVSTYLSSLEKLRHAKPNEAYCITFSAFCAMCDKSDSMTLRDVYLKMLMCTRGVTGDKAIEIQKLWNTPQALIEAYEKLGNDTKKRDSMISDKLADKVPRKKVAKTLSAKIAEVWAAS